MKPMVGKVDRVLTSADAQTMQDEGKIAAWFVTASDPLHPGKFVARPHTCEHDGGRYLPLVLVADTIEDLRARLPGGVTQRRELCCITPPDVIEFWD